MSELPWDQILKLAEGIGVKEHARTQWRTRRRVPPRWHYPLVQEAAKHGVSLTIEQLAATWAASGEAA